MPNYIKYDSKTGKFHATGERPGNQNSKPVLRKIAKRMAKYAQDHPEIKLTKLQEKFIKHLKKCKSHYKLSSDDINIAHCVAISKIIKYFIRVMNNTNRLHLRKAKGFVNAILSTESPDNDRISAFFDSVKNGDKTGDELAKDANKIIHLLNKCSRNYGVGYARPNQAIHSDEDPVLVQKKDDKHKMKEVKYASSVAKNFKKIFHDYGPKTDRLSNGKKIIYSSSVNKNKDRSYVQERDPDCDSDCSYNR